jgi:small-conductance mechanosensitive channel
MLDITALAQQTKPRKMEPMTATAHMILNRWRVRGPLLALAVALAAVAMPARAQLVPVPLVSSPAAAPAASPDDGLDAIKAELDNTKAQAEAGGATDQALLGLRNKLSSLRGTLRDKIEVLTPRLADLDNRLKQIGDPPAPDAPAEEPALAKERKQLVETRAAADAALRRARLLQASADELTTFVDDSRRALFSRALLQRTPGILTADFWRETATAALNEAADFAALLRIWRADAVSRGGIAGITAAGFLLAVFAAVSIAVLRWWRRRFRELSEWSRFGRAAAALFVLLRESVVVPALFVVSLKVIEMSGLLPPAAAQLGNHLALAIAIASFGRAAAVAALAPHQPARRLIRLSDARARLYAGGLIWCARALGVTLVLNHVHVLLFAPLSATIATSALLSVLIAIIVVEVLRRSPHAETETGEDSGVIFPGLRLLGWVFAAVLVVALLTGYIGLAAFLASRAIVIAVLLAAYFVVAVFIDALFSEVVTANTERGRHLAMTFGMSPRAVELVGAVMAAFLKVAFALICIVLVVGSWGVDALDYVGDIRNALFGFQIGGLTISLSSIAAAIVLLLVGIALTRAAQRWLDRKFLPRTALEPGLQNSVSALLGYAGYIAAIVIAMAELGIDLQKIALIAGALSVGIGFGLQSVVSNFVSGIILLAERPIRVGDWVVVKGEEGFVRRISVRATEVETFDRASVIIPNSELITGVVKNWTHANTLGRLTIKVGVSYDSDPERVRELLAAAAEAHPQVEHTPPPTVLFAGFGDSALEFELRCIVPNIAQAFVVKSDLHFDIFRRLREAGIEIPFPQREVWLRSKGDPAAHGV